MSLEQFEDLIEGCAITEEYFEIPPNHQILQSALKKSQNPRTKNTLSLRVYGAYSLPKSWQEKIGDPGEDAYQYEVKLSGLEIKGAKLQAREMSEEEKAEQEATKGKKGAKKGEEEPLPEELVLKEKIDKEREELEEMSERDRFFRLQEDPTKTISLKFDDPKQSLPLLKEKLWDFEDLVNEENGAYIEFNKVQASEEDADPKKKGKGKQPDSIEQHFSKGWIDFTPLMVPGRKHTMQRVLLKACAPPVVESEGDDDESKEGDEDQEEKEPEPIFEEAQTYLHIHLSTEFAINPTINPNEVDPPEIPDPVEGEGEGEGKPEEEKQESEKQEPPKEDAVEEEKAEDDGKPEDSYIEEDEIIEDEKPKIELKDEIYQNIDFKLGKFSSTSDATSNFRIIIQKYLKKISDHYSIIMSQDEVDQKSNSKIAAIPTHATSTQRQKKIEKYILQSGPMYSALKKEMKMAIHRIIKDKYLKTVNHEGLSKENRDEFIAKLYTYLTKQVRVTLKATVEKYKDIIHEDLTEDLFTAMKEEEEQRSKAFTEDYKVKLDRLAQEYENIRNFPKAEKYYKKLLLKDPKDVSQLLNLARFSMKIGKVDQGYEYFRMARDIDPTSRELILAYAGILIQRERYTEASNVLNEIISQDFNDCHANILLSIIDEARQRPGLVRKHVAIAKVQRMRELDIIPKKIKEIPNLNEINFKLERPNWDTIVTKDQSMEAKDNDKLFFEVIEFMLKHHLTKIADSLLQYIQNVENDKYRLNFARVKHQMKEFEPAIESLDKILSKNDCHPQALVLRGHTYFDYLNIFDSEESYIKFIQNCSAKDLESRLAYYFLIERLGIVYIERRAWKDAKTVFLKCAEENQTSNGWLNLGIACLRLHQYEEAEDALTQANFLDSHNPEIWGYITLLCLKYPDNSRADQAEYCILRALRLGCENPDLLEEIGDIYSDSKPTFAIGCFDRALEIDDSRGEVYQKYGNVLMNHKKNEIKKAIDLLKQALEKLKGDGKKAHCALILQEALKEDGRYEEAEEYAEYPQNHTAEQ
ncbi:unnamed protein product [Moneuplotes crassus]|uniref:Uncharacterized protein n=1 Tax=Euplotes crassus TaxID=5936 RepID=A0AAD1XVP7_EUPCR|nr:unnamed protein product [Moneuplotes crassus]